MIGPIAALFGGVVLLILSANKFVEGSAATAKRAGLPPVLIGMVVMGFGSSIPEVVVSTLSALAGTPGLALGNALGSNITNISLILGTTALIRPISVKSSVLQRELPLLALVTAIAALLLFDDGVLSRVDGWALIGVFTAVMVWSIFSGLRVPADELATDVTEALTELLSLPRALSYLILGLLMLVISSRFLVWGGTRVAHALGISDVVIGLSIVAVGTSLPELASSIIAVRKGEYGLVIGNVIGSNMFNTTIVVGVAGIIDPARLDHGVLSRDFPVMTILTLILFILGYRFRGPGTGRINRFEGALLVIAYISYNTALAVTAIATAST